MRALVFVLALVGCSAEPPEPRLAYQRLEAPTTRGECRNHQYVVIYTDAHGLEREVDNGEFCELN